MNNKTESLGSAPIAKLIAQFSIPAIIAMLINAIYNVVDRIFIAQYAGEDALAGLTIAFPVMLLLFAFFSLVGIGGSALISIKLGEKDEKGASHVFGNTLAFGLLITIICCVTLYFNLEKVLYLFGGTASLVGFASAYLRIILMGNLFQALSFILSSTVRTEGKPILSMLSMIVSAVVNIILDYIFIAHFGWGVEGAALATVIGQASGLVILLSFYLRGKSHLHIKAKDFIIDLPLVAKISSIGFSTFITTIGTSLTMTFLNRALGEYGGTAAITSMGAINSLFTLFIMPIMGIQQGLQPIMGYNFGAKSLKRVYQTLGLGLVITTVFATVVFLILQSFPHQIIALFIDPQSPTVAVAVHGLRIYVLMLPLLSINMLGIAYFQSTAKVKVSLWLSMLRQIILLIPLVLILPRFFGLDGAWFATPISDALAILITIVMLLLDFKKENIRSLFKKETAMVVE